MCNQKLDFKREKALKRQNSHTPVLDEFGDQQYVLALQRELQPIRGSFKKKRKGVNLVIKDYPKARIDLELQSDAGSVQTAYKSQKFKPLAQIPGQINAMGVRGMMISGGGMIMPGMDQQWMAGMGSGMLQIQTNSNGERFIRSSNGELLPVMNRPDGTQWVNQGGHYVPLQFFMSQQMTNPLTQNYGDAGMGGLL